MPKRHMTRTEIIKANDLMKQHIVPSERAGFVKYQGDWSDAKIASEIAPDIQAHAIGNLRQELFGKLETSKNVAEADNQKLKEVETVIQNLLDCYQNLERKYNLLIDNLCLNKVANVKHLKTTEKE